MFTTFAKAAIQATGLAEYVPAFTFTSPTTAVTVESPPDEAPLENSAGGVDCASLQSDQAEETQESPLKGQETPILKERPTGPERVSRITTRDEDLERQAKKAARKAIPGAFFVAEVSDEECEILMNPTVSFTHAIRPGGPGRDHSDKNQAEKPEASLKSKASELSIRKRNRQLEEENAELKAEKIARELYIETLKNEVEAAKREDRLVESGETGIGLTSDIMERTVSGPSLRKQEHDDNFDVSERGEKQSIHTGSEGSTPTRGRSRYRNAFSRATAFMPYPKRSKSKAQQPYRDSSGRREIPINDSPPSIFPTPPASIGYASSKNTSQASGSSHSADDGPSLDTRGKQIAPASPLSPGDELKNNWLSIRTLTGRSSSRGPSPSPASHESALPETPTRPRPQRPAMPGSSASVPTPSRRLPSLVSTGPRRQTSPLLSGRGSSNKKRKQEDVQAYTSLDAQVQVQSWYADDPAPPASVSASKRRKNG